MILCGSIKTVDKPLTLEEVQKLCEDSGLERCDICQIHEFCYSVLENNVPSGWDNYDGWNKTP